MLYVGNVMLPTAIREYGAEEPYEVVPHVRTCGGRREQSRFLPGMRLRSAGAVGQLAVLP